MSRSLDGGGVFYERILGMYSDGMERVDLKIGVGDNHRISHPLEFPGV